VGRLTSLSRSTKGKTCDEMAKRALIYCRQSLTKADEDGDKDDSLSLDFQERESRLYALRNGWTVIDPPILDPDVKGWDPLRPGIVELLKRIDAERADTVIVYAMSRFARDYVLQETIWRKLVERGANLVSVHEPHVEDDLVRGILGVVSQAERKRMGAFLSSAFRERARRGLPHGKTPFGFAKDADGRLVVRDDARDTVLAIVERLESGWSLWRVAKWLNEDHVDGRSWEPNVVRNTVKTPAIAGGIRTADVMTWDTHEPIIARERWDRLIVLLESRRPIRTKGSSSWLEGRMVCGCGAPMHLITDKFNSTPPAGQFRCSANPHLEPFQRPRRFPPCSFSPRSIMQHAAERSALDAFSEAFGAIPAWEDVYRQRSAHYLRDEPTSIQDRARLTKQRDKLQDERERLLVLYRRGTLDVERWEREDTDLDQKITDVTTWLDALPAPPTEEAIQKSAALLGSMREIWIDLVRDHPEDARLLLMETDARVQRTATGTRIMWPEDLAVFFPEIV